MVAFTVRRSIEEVDCSNFDWSIVDLGREFGADSLLSRVARKTIIISTTAVEVRCITFTTIVGIIIEAASWKLGLSTGRIELVVGCYHNPSYSEECVVFQTGSLTGY